MNSSQWRLLTAASFVVWITSLVAAGKVCGNAYLEVAITAAPVVVSATGWVRKAVLEGHRVDATA